MSIPDEYALLSATWILASNDENPMITYQGLRKRLSLPVAYPVNNLVINHPELFRQGLPQARLDQWKADMENGKRLPGFVRDLPLDERSACIAALQSHDGFRSQFRASPDAARSEVPVIEWGLNHIERLRKARNEAKEATAKSWQLWLVFGTSLLGVAATVVAAFIKSSN